MERYNPNELLHMVDPKNEEERIAISRAINRMKAQQQEINRLEVQVEADKDLIRELNNSYINSELNLSALASDKDEQAGRIMRMEEGIKKAKQIFRNIEIITSCPETGNERNAMQMAIDGHRLMVALLGGEKDA